MSRVFPEGRWVDLDVDAPDLPLVLRDQLARHHPAVLRPAAGRIFRALFEDNDPNKRLMVVANYNTDMSEFWECSDTGLHAGRRDQRGVQDRHQRVHVRHHSLSRSRGVSSFETKGRFVESTIAARPSSHGFAGGHRARRQDECRPQAASRPSWPSSSSARSDVIASGAADALRRRQQPDRRRARAWPRRCSSGRWRRCSTSSSTASSSRPT